MAGTVIAMPPSIAPLDSIVYPPSIAPVPSIAFVSSGATPVDPDAQDYFDIVDGLGGTIPAADQTRISARFTALKAAGLFDIMDRLYAVSTDSVASVVSWKNPGVAIVFTGGVTFTANRGITYNGTDGWGDTGFVPSVNGVNFAGNDGMIMCYSRTNVGVNSVYQIGGINNSTTQGYRINSRTAGNLIQSMANSASFTTANTNGVGLYGTQRTPAGIFTNWKNGALSGTAAPATSGTVLPTRAVYTGAFNNNGTVAGFWAGQHSLYGIAKSFTALQWANFFSIMVTGYLAVIGAN